MRIIHLAALRNTPGPVLIKYHPEFCGHTLPQTYYIPALNGRMPYIGGFSKEGVVVSLYLPSPYPSIAKRILADHLLGRAPSTIFWAHSTAEAQWHFKPHLRFGWRRWKELQENLKNCKSRGFHRVVSDGHPHPYCTECRDQGNETWMLEQHAFERAASESEYLELLLQIDP